MREGNISKLYQWLNRKNWEKLILIILIICIAFDIVPFEYWPVFKCIFDVDKGNCAAIAGMILVVWTFTMALVVFWLGRMAERQYGICVIDAYVRSISKAVSEKNMLKGKPVEGTPEAKAVKKIVEMGRIVIIELIAVFLAAFYGWVITILVTAIFQILAMIYTLVAVCVESSRKNILEQIRESSVEYIVGDFEKGKGINDFLGDMIANTEFKRESEINQLNQMATEIVTIASKKLLAKNNWRLQWYMKAYMDYMIRVCKDKDTSERIVKNLFRACDNVSAKKGIFFSVIENEYQEEAPDAVKVIGINFEERELVVAAGIVYNQYISFFRDHHKYLTAGLKKCIEYPLPETMKAELVDVWRELIKEDKQNNENDSIKWNLDRIMETFSREEE